MGIARESRNKAQLLLQGKKLLEERITEFNKEAKEMYETFLVENKLNGVVKFKGYPLDGTVGKLKVVQTVSMEAEHFNGLPEVRFFEWNSQTQSFAGLGVGFGVETFESAMDYILEHFEPYRRTKIIRERDRFDEK